ncbi:hypothetical protein, partial [Thiohalocapsa marina]|uniref:hypothetical protein n=1 Tax=Thiohalocapsa marina TaxID=424902 RepID=UPI001B878995
KQMSPPRHQQIHIAQAAYTTAALHCKSVRMQKLLRARAGLLLDLLAVASCRNRAQAGLCSACQ